MIQSRAAASIWCAKTHWVFLLLRLDLDVARACEVVDQIMGVLLVVENEE